MHDSPIFCKICNYSYFPSIAGESEHHEKFHESAVKGIQIRISKLDRVIAKNNDYQLIIIDSNSTLPQFNRLNKISKFISASLFRDNFTYHVRLLFPVVPEHKFFLLCTKSRIIGYFDIKFFPKSIDKPVWLVKMIWLAGNYRNKGLAKYIIESSLSILETDLSSVVWETPFSKSGLEFIKSLCPNGYTVSNQKS